LNSYSLFLCILWCDFRGFLKLWQYGFSFKKYKHHGLMSISLFWHVSLCVGQHTLIPSCQIQTKKLLKTIIRKRNQFILSKFALRECKTKKLLGKIHSDKASINKSIKYSQAAYLLWYTNVFSGFSVFSEASGASEQSSM